MFEYYSFLQYKHESWTKEHENSLLLALNKKLPVELISIIDNYIDKRYEYLYYIPFNLLNNDYDGTISFAYGVNVKINIKTEDNKNEGKLYIKSINQLSFSNGTGRLLFVL